MAFPVSLWKINKRENSTYRPAGTAKVYQCVSNTDFDILSPDIPLNIGLTENPTSYNYAYISAFGRYYFVTNWRVQNGMWWASLRVDVLASWKTDIGAQVLYVDRSASDFDTTIADTTYFATADFTVNSVPFTLQDSDQHQWKTSGVYSDGTFVMGVIGKGGAVNYWAFPASNYEKFMQSVFNFDYGFADEQVKAVFNPIQYITSVIWLPFSLAGVSTGTINVDFGWWTIGDKDSGGFPLHAGKYINFGASVNLPKHPQQTRGNWLNGAPYSKYLLKLPCFGMLDIQGYDMLDSTSINITIDVDCATGKAICYIRPSSVKVNTQVVEMQVGCPVQVAQIQSSMLSMGANWLRNTGAVGKYVSDSISGAFAGMSGLIGGITGLANFDFSDKASVSGTVGSLAATKIDGAVIAIFQHLANENLPDKGRPLCERKMLNTLSGYMQISDADIGVPCTVTELAEIRSYMNGGFFYE
jgi:hypothetical protein